MLNPWWDISPEIHIPPPGADPVVTPAGNVLMVSQAKRAYCVEPDGETVWDRHVGDAIDAAPAIGPDGTAYISTFKVLTALTRSGSVRWSFEHPTACLSSPALGLNGTVYVKAGDGTFYAFRDSRRPIWKVAVGTFGGPDAPAIAPDGSIYLTALATGLDTGELLKMDGGGRILWRRRPSSGCFFSGAPALDVRGTVYAVAPRLRGFNPYRRFEQSYVYAYRSDGSFLWRYGISAEVRSNPVIGPNGTLLVPTEAGPVVVLE